MVVPQAGQASAGKVEMSGRRALALGFCIIVFLSHEMKRA